VYSHYIYRADIFSAKPEGRRSLVWTCVKCLRWPLLSVVPPRLCLIGFNYAQPFLISRMISFVNQPRASQNYNQSLGLIAAAALIYTGVAVSVFISPRKDRDANKVPRYLPCATCIDYFGQSLCFGADSSALSLTRHFFCAMEYMMNLREYIIFVLVTQLPVLICCCSAITHMSTDIDRITASMQSMHETWARLIEVSIGVWLLSIQLGAVSVIPIIVVISKLSTIIVS
jgi:ATP-binding cassette, subfamily C (CFTR/MRP), member 1